jgi:hypothetical protein
MMPKKSFLTLSAAVPDVSKCFEKCFARKEIPSDASKLVETDSSEPSVHDFRQNISFSLQSELKKPGYYFLNGAMTLSMPTFSIMTLSIKSLNDT